MFKVFFESNTAGFQTLQRQEMLDLDKPILHAMGLLSTHLSSLALTFGKLCKK